MVILRLRRVSVHGVWCYYDGKTVVDFLRRFARIEWCRVEEVLMGDARRCWATEEKSREPVGRGSEAWLSMVSSASVAVVGSWPVISNSIVCEVSAVDDDHKETRRLWVVLVATFFRIRRPTRRGGVDVVVLALGESVELITCWDENVKFTIVLYRIVPRVYRIVLTALWLVST